MEQLNYYDLENILSNCVSGQIIMNQPIEVANKLKNQRTEISILKHLLVLCQSDRTSLIHILSILRHQLKNKLLELIDENSLIHQYIQNVIREWRLDLSPSDLFKDGLDQCDYFEGDDIFNYDDLLLEKTNIQQGGNKLQVLENSLRERQQTYTPITRDYAEQMQEKIKDLHTECSECMNRVKGHTSKSMDISKSIDPEYSDVLLDLSTKYKSTYLEFSNRIKEDESYSLATFLHETNDLNIPDNIHIIFLNYLVTLNMIKKEMNYITYSFKGMLSEFQPKMVILEKFMDGSDGFEGFNIVEETPKSSVPEEPSSGFLGFSFF